MQETTPEQLDFLLLAIHSKNFVRCSTNLENFPALREQFKLQIAQNRREIMDIQQQIAKLDKNGKNFMSVSLTGQANDAIITFNGMKIILAILDMLIHGVRFYPDNSMGIEWNFDSTKALSSIWA